MTQQAWDAHLYDSKHAFVTEYGRGVLDLLGPHAGERILDVGCGTGHLTHEIAQSGAHVSGFDASEAMIGKARAAYPQIDFSVKDATNFEYPQPFDAIFSNATLHWVRPPEDAVRCMARALRPGGRFVIEMGGHGNVEKTSRALADAAQAVAGVAISHNWYFPSIGAYCALLDAHGLETSSAWLFDRPTKLEGGDGLRNWYRQFGDHMLRHVPAQFHAAVLEEAEARAKPHLLRDGVWYADYRRLRVVASKVG